MVVDPRDVHGVWGVALLPWLDDWSLDEVSFRANMDRTLAQQPDGYYTLDTASEFYTLEFPDWLAVATMFVDHCTKAAPDIPLGLGCTWTNQTGAIDRIKAARDLGVTTIHLSPPYWTTLDLPGVCRFFEAVQEHAGHLGIVVYAPPWASIDLDGPTYAKLKAVAPNIIGSKTTAKHPDIFDQPSSDKRDSHFVGEPWIFEAYKRGATGAYSSLSGFNVKFVQNWINLMKQGDWQAAGEINDRVQKFYEQGVVPCRNAGILAGANDKAFAQIGGAVGSRALRPPYPVMPDDLYAGVEKAARQWLPEIFG